MRYLESDRQMEIWFDGDSSCPSTIRFTNEVYACKSRWRFMVRFKIWLSQQCVKFLAGMLKHEGQAIGSGNPAVVINWKPEIGKDVPDDSGYWKGFWRGCSTNLPNDAYVRLTAENLHVFEKRLDEYNASGRGLMVHPNLPDYLEKQRAKK